MGQLYTAKYFPASSKTEINTMVDGIRAAFAKRIVLFRDGHVVEDRANAPQDAAALQRRKLALIAEQDAYFAASTDMSRVSP